MIGYLQGTVIFKDSHILLINVGGVGYKVFTPLSVITSINLNDKLSVFTFTHVKDDAIELYGFPTQKDLLFFELLLGVSGVGPKTALSVFGRGKLSQIKEAVVKGDVDFFMAVPRLGRKNAQKIIIELRPKLGSLAELDLTVEGSESKELIDALKSLGYDREEAKEAYKSIKDLEGTTEQKLRQALKALGKK